MVRRTGGLLLLLVLATGACTRGGGADDVANPTSTSTTEALLPPTSTTVPPDIAAIPDVIDEAYLNRVLEALDAVDGMATRIIVARKNFVREAADILGAIYDDNEFTSQANAWLADLDRDPELGMIRRPPGNRRTTVARIITRTPACVWLAVTRDYSGVAADPGTEELEYVALRPLDKSNDARGLNPTAWMITSDGFNEDGSEPADQCR